MDIVSSLVADGDGASLSSIASVLPSDSVVWLDSSELYSEQEFFGEYSSFKKVYLNTPVNVSKDDSIKFSIAPQPIFNKNFELLTADIRSRLDSGYAVYI